jgi:imidazolonepropionase
MSAGGDPGSAVLWRDARIATCDARARVFERGAVLSEGGRIAWVGDERNLPAAAARAEIVDLDGRWLTPGLVDCHTHLVFAGQRAAEFARRTAGESYAGLATEGGGILATVHATRAADEAALYDASRARLESLLAEGVTTVEIKSGYGLALEHEARMLRVARRLGANYPVRVVTSLLAAHALPPEYAGRADAYVDAIVEEWLPALHAEGLVDAVDAYCEGIAFDVAQCERLFAAATARGLPLRLHTEQLSNIGGSQLAARHRAASVDHLEYTTAQDAAALAAAGTVAVLLPVAYYVLAQQQPPPVAALRDAGVPLAVASDCNPGTAPGASLLLALHMARRQFGLGSQEVLLGATRHAARALGLGAVCGALEAGLAADFAIWSIETLDELGYWAGFNPCHAVVVGGELVRERIN